MKTFIFSCYFSETNVLQRNLNKNEIEILSNEQKCLSYTLKLDFKIKFYPLLFMKKLHSK
jgi:hypothetical protein